MRKIIFFCILFCAQMVNAEVALTPTLPIKEIIIKGHKVKVEVADNDEKRKVGLMNRKSLAPDHGMLFIFEDESIQHFWMKNTFIPLSIGFFNKNYKLVDLQDMEPMKSVMQSQVPTYSSKRPAQYVLEVNQGWFKKNKIQLGDTFQFINK